VLARHAKAPWLPNAISLGIGSWELGVGTWDLGLLDLAAWAQAAGDAGRDGRSNESSLSAWRKRDQIAGLIVRISKLAQERVELLAADMLVADPAAASGYIVVKSSTPREAIERPPLCMYGAVYARLRSDAVRNA